MSHIPSQERVIDPFASYNSNVVNKITEVVTQGADGILTADSLQGTIDSTATSAVTISTGYVVKDDVLIHITTNHQVDFTDVNHFASGQLPTVGGYYYIVLDYQYAKSRPAPVASIQILTPSERSLLTVGSSYFLLKVVELSNSGPHPILNLYDYDPDTPANERKYIKFYAGTERTIPTFAKHTDQSRIAYETNRDKFFFGFKDGWRELSAGGVSVDVNTDSTAVTAVGQLCYVDSNRTAIPAIATSRHTGADIVVLSRGTVSAGTGRGSVAGYVSDVPVETANLIDIGDLLYLSAVDAGTVTNVRPSPFYQVVGRALSQGSSTTPIQMIFSPKVLLAISLEGQISSWLGPDGDGLYYNTIDVSTLDGTNAYACHWFDNETHEELQPEKVKIYAAGDYIRVYFLDSTTIVDYIIMSGATIGSHSEGGGGGSGVTDHALLTDLDYAHAGHTGFAPSPHGNADHTSTFITASSVNFTTLNNNGSVGTGAAQVAIGNHTHANLVDVPSGAIILFESNVAVSGYTLLTTINDAIVYITKGSASGGETGGNIKSGSTWTQPTHAHSINYQSDHYHTGGSHYHNVTLPEGGWPTASGQGAYRCTASVPDYYSHIAARTISTTSAVGNTGYAGGHDHGGSTVAGGTPNTWRPRGYNYTRQQRI